MAWTAPRTWVAAETLTAALMNAHVRDNFNAAFPVGSLHWRMQSETSIVTDVDGFGLECNGAAYTRASYSSLNTLLSGLSFPFGSGNGTTTANLPDMRGRTLVACGSHADVDIGDNEGSSEANRTPKHNTSDTFDVSGSPGGTFVTSVTPSYLSRGSSGSNVVLDISTATGSPTAGSLGISGSAGPGGTRPTDMPAYVTPGIVIVKY